ncbi:MAG: HAD family hydrolase [Acidimicrobiales bacterium]
MIPGPIAIFDLDRTMHAGSGLGVLSRHAFRANFISGERMARSFVHDFVFRKGASTDGHINSIAEFALEMGGGKSLHELEPIIEATTTEIVDSVRIPMMAVLELHRNAGHHCVLLSASPQHLVTRIAESLGFERGIGTVIDVDDDGVLTGKIRQPMCYGEGKLERLTHEIGWPSSDGRSGSIASYAYADSMSDLPLLEAVEAPFVVAPDRKLRQLAEERDWPVLDVRP